MNPDFVIDPSAADARRETRRCIPILQAPRNKADAAFRTIPRGLRNGLFAPFSVFTFLCLFVQITQRPKTMFCRQVRQPGHFSNAKSGKQDSAIGPTEPRRGARSAVTCSYCLRPATTRVPLGAIAKSQLDMLFNWTIFQRQTPL